MTTSEQERMAALQEENERLRASVESLQSFIRTRMGPYVTYEVLDEIMSQQGGGAIEGERREVTMLFTDIRRSTELSERMTATDYIRLLNHYLSDMIDIIDAWQGNILGFVGDAIVAVFGAPKPNEEAAFQAVGSAVAMQRRMKAVNAWNREQGYPAIQMGIGIHTGEAILGCVGSQTRMKYDMIGRNVNLASRIEGFTKGGQILVSSETLEAAGDMVVERPEGAMWVSPKGIQCEVLVHDVIGFGKLRIPEQ
ncbi:MAG: adenylate/guanylate cyclase domain-containing protein [Coriobacteriales bacterium]|nr:adenylate/guanylate cyclase domain-containing protein [Coriobacteriales bacterium]